MANFFDFKKGSSKKTHPPPDLEDSIPGSQPRKQIKRKIRKGKKRPEIKIIFEKEEEVSQKEKLMN